LPVEDVLEGTTRDEASDAFEIGLEPSDVLEIVSRASNELVHHATTHRRCDVSRPPGRDARRTVSNSSTRPAFTNSDNAVLSRESDRFHPVCSDANRISWYSTI